MVHRKAFAAFFTALSLTLFAACAPITPVSPRASVATVRSDADVQVTESGDAALVDVISPTGIGGAEVTLADPPDAVTVRLHLSGLEEYRFGYDETEILLSISSSDASVRQSIRRSGGAEEEIGPASPHWMETRILDASGAVTTTLPLHHGVFEIDAPPDFIEKERQSFSLMWIDFYR